MDYKLTINELWMHHEILDGDPCVWTPFIIWSCLMLVSITLYVTIVLENNLVISFFQRKAPHAFLLPCSFIFSWLMEHKFHFHHSSFPLGTFLLSFKNGTSKQYLLLVFQRLFHHYIKVGGAYGYLHCGLHIWTILPSKWPTFPPPNSSSKI
jgi:hypothetical protein